ncbi:MAG: SAM-dependent methyltransferase [Streptosporangiaceae bacterium]
MAGEEGIRQFLDIGTGLPTRQGLVKVDVTVGSGSGL